MGVFSKVDEAGIQKAHPAGGKPPNVLGAAGPAVMVCCLECACLSCRQTPEENHHEECKAAILYCFSSSVVQDSTRGCAYCACLKDGVVLDGLCITVTIIS